MKNKKIILGLGTISALGAMSMAFVACGSKDQLKGYVKKDEVFDTYEIAKLDKTINKAFAKTGTGDSEINPKNVGELKKDAKVSDLIAKVQSLDQFKGFKIISKEDDKKDDIANGKTLSGTTHKLVFTWKNEPDDTKIKVEVEFTFTLKTTA